ncbi:MAG: M23 family metallopeptidase [Alphaproteobacteria bacterium]|nr:M23 family metallopeptidase [Alphaproteobacteria bacterium]
MQTLRVPIRTANPQRAPVVIPRPRAMGVGPAALEKPDAQNTGVAFEWPIEGKVIAHFGRDGGGLRNDGINIAAEPGTPIHAAASGTVIYADKLKGYGRLILVRHDNRYITAYAHAQSILVASGDHVARGDVIGYSGATGDIRTPQLHFEIRQGAKPVDPKPLLMAARES